MLGRPGSCAMVVALLPFFFSAAEAASPAAVEPLVTAVTGPLVETTLALERSVWERRVQADIGQALFFASRALVNDLDTAIELTLTDEQAAIDAEIAAAVAATRAEG